MACAVVSKPVAKCALHLSIKVTQWRSQITVDARAQRGHSTFVGISAQNEGTKLGGRGGGDAPPENFGIFELTRSVLRLFQAIPSP